MLWKRIRDFLNDITIDGDPKSQHIHGVKCLLQGTWQPYHLNEVLPVY